MNMYLRSGIFVGLAVLTVALCLIFPNAGSNSEPGLIMRLPEDTPKYRSEDVPVSKIVLATLPKDTTFVKKAYFEKGLPENLARYRQLAVTLILQGSDRRSLHEPEICLVGQGWDIEKSIVVPVETLGGNVRVRNLHLGRWLKNKDGTPVLNSDGNKVRARAHYVYWWVAKDSSTPNAKERIMKTALRNMFQNINDRWGYPSIMVPVDGRFPEKEGREEACQRAYDFIKNYAPMFQKSLGAKELDAES